MIQVTELMWKPKQPHTGTSQFLSQENKFLLQVLSGKPVLLNMPLQQTDTLNQSLKAYNSRWTNKLK
jgi:hypothetical protein